ADLGRTQIPALLQQVIEARLARLDETTQRLLEVAAVIGQDVPLQLWSVVAEADDASLAQAIEDAVAAGLLTVSDGGTILRFTHALLRETIYERQMLLRRRPWHRRAAEALIAAPHPDPDAIAYHLEQVNDPRLVDWLIRSGERAQQRFAWPAAARQFDRAQAMLASDPDRDAERAWLLFRIAVLVRNTDQSGSLTYLDEAEQIATALGDPVLTHLSRAHRGLVLCYGRDVRQGLIDLEAGTRALERLDEEDVHRLRSVTADWEAILGVQGRATLAQWLANVGRFQQARELLLSWSDSERDAAPDAHRAAGIIASSLGEPELARRWFRRSRAVYETRNDRFQAGDDAFHELLDFHIPYAADRAGERRALVRTLLDLWTDPTDPDQSTWATQAIEAIECVISGQWSQADEWYDQHRTDWRFPLSPFGFWWLLLARHRGEAEVAWAAIRAALPDGPATEPGGQGYAVLAGLQLMAAELALDASDLPRSRAWLEAHDRLLEWSIAVRGRAENHLAWARYHQRAGDGIAARDRAERALAQATDPHQPLALIAAQRFFGQLAIADQRYDLAEQRLTASLTLAAACAAPFERALTLAVLAELHAGTGDLDAAQRVIEEARSICEPLRAVPTLAHLNALEAQLETQRGATNLPAGLSVREAEVLRLVAQGLSDAEVAEQLFIARRTVNTHLTSIYTKLGVNSRVAATRFAVEHHLT
ncbi:MAG TPA: LuxR C-terminal-related transcriptional regulator, partial [Thermomicrobiales bacterium]|nr:LuxR C-terminal-related transcriptional regulator [Thermomicrobiales bacterium]